MCAGPRPRPCEADGIPENTGLQDAAQLRSPPDQGTGACPQAERVTSNSSQSEGTARHSSHLPRTRGEESYFKGVVDLHTPLSASRLNVPALEQTGGTIPKEGIKSTLVSKY